jgi:hypothetical protein
MKYEFFGGPFDGQIIDGVFDVDDKMADICITEKVCLVYKLDHNRRRLDFVGYGEYITEGQK